MFEGNSFLRIGKGYKWQWKQAWYTGKNVNLDVTVTWESGLCLLWPIGFNLSSSSTFLGHKMVIMLATVSRLWVRERFRLEIECHPAWQMVITLVIVRRACEVLKGVRDLAEPFVQEATAQAGCWPRIKIGGSLVFEVALTPHASDTDVPATASLPTERRQQGWPETRTDLTPLLALGAPKYRLLDRS